MSKKSQSEIVTTVLLILIVLAAIAVVWIMVVQFFPKPGENPFACNDIRLVINAARSNETASHGHEVEIKRMGGGEDDAVKSVKILINKEATTIQAVNDIDCIDDDDRPQNGPDNSDADVTPDETDTDDDNDGLLDSDPAETDRNGNLIIDTDPAETDPDDIQECAELHGERTLYSLQQIETKSYMVPVDDLPPGALVEIAPIIEENGEEKVCNINDNKRAA